MKTLASYIKGTWCEGDGPAATLVNPATAEPLAHASTGGVDFAGAVAYARDRGGPALRAMTFAERGALLQRLADVIHAGREQLIALAIENGGNTRSDAKFDIDGASATLAAYARLGAQLGDARALADGDGVQLGRSPRLHGRHVWTSRRGVAVHINAFNFPAWGLAEKAACALLAGMPVITKPATATALVSWRLMQMFVEAGALPDGALQFVCGGAGDLLDHLGGQDVVAFTGSSGTAAALRAMRCAVERSTRVNVEADSLNAAVLGPDVEPGSETEDLFVADVVRDMSQKAGQKCTAIRRAFVPADRLDALAERLAERLADIRVGNPADDGVRMGPVATAQQLADVRAGIDRLAAETSEVFTGAAPDGPGYFVPLTLRRTDDPASARALHAHEVFGPVATIAPYDGTAAAAAALVRLGGGGLVASVYSDDRAFLADVVLDIAADHGRVFVGSRKIAGQSPGPGTVLPQLVHGGPGRAGGGEELGGERGLHFYMQRTAIEGDKALLSALPL
ncbi:MAG: 3,4-dehydroadipyl-CoA semialdehyde dehydrogenase [Deltaproteobacteria bacterium]|nr:MAG: 3,4-dehydroadipyl-CoA semialdehyde dehydrogenase [Deltaproteobacteria bacterium]